MNQRNSSSPFAEGYVELLRDQNIIGVDAVPTYPDQGLAVRTSEIAMAHLQLVPVQDRDVYYGSIHRQLLGRKPIF